MIAEHKVSPEEIGLLRVSDDVEEVTAMIVASFRSLEANGSAEDLDGPVP